MLTIISSLSHWAKKGAVSSVSNSLIHTWKQSINAQSINQFATATKAVKKVSKSTQTKKAPAKATPVKKSIVKKTVAKTPVKSVAKSTAKTVAPKKTQVDRVQKSADKAKLEKDRQRALKEKQREKEQKSTEKKKQENERLKAKEKVRKAREQKNAAIAARKEKKRKEKEIKDAKPKRARSAYLYYMLSITPQLRKENPNGGVSDIAKIAGARWNALDDKAKQPFIAEAAKDKKRYDAEKKEAAKNAPPKRPLSAYIIFVNDVRPQILKEKPDLKITEAMVKIGERWRKLGAAEKEKYNVKAKKLLDEYTKKYGQIVKNQ